MRRLTWLETSLQDLRFGVRVLRRSAGFTAAAVLLLALGIGANAAVFALADAAWLRPLPFQAPNRLVMLREQRADGPMAVTPADFFDWTTRATAFQGVAAMMPSTLPFVAPNGLAESVPTQAVSVGFFEVLGVAPIVGRTFTPADEQGRADVAVLAEAFWRARFGGDPAIVGRSIRLDGRPFTVVGIVPASMQLLPPVPNAGGANVPSALWTVFVASPNASRQAHFLQVIARLKPGITMAAARQDIATVASGLAREYPETNRGHGAGLESMRAVLIGPEVRLTSIVLLGVAGCVLLLCCANVATLLVTRGAGRQREMAVRSAMGASPVRIATQAIIETLVLSVLGGLAGAVVAAAVLGTASTLVPPGLLPAAVTPSVDLTVLAFGSAIVLVVALACGLAPARYGARASLTQVMGAGERVVRHGGGLRTILAAAQVAAAIVVLCGAALLLRSLIALDARDNGYRAANILTAVVNLPLPFGATTRYATPEAMRQYYDNVEREVQMIPGVRRVAWGSAMPLDGFWFGQPFEVAGDPPKPPANRDLAEYQIVSASYFSTLGIAVLEGRDFTRADAADAPPVCIVNEAFVRRFLSGRHPIGMRLRVPQLTVGTPSLPDREIVGVARQVRALANETDPIPQIYVPQAQNPWYSATLVVQSALDTPEALFPAMRAAAAHVDPDRPLRQLRTMDTIAADATARWRFRAHLVGAFAAVALTLALVGVFGLLAYAVQQRTHEFGVRLAIGATGADIARLVLGNTVRVAGSGILIGMAAAGILSRGMTSLLFGVPPLDAVSFSSAAMVLSVTAMLAAVGPALRAVRVNPVTTLKRAP